jgi:hypothetical protein
VKELCLKLLTFKLVALLALVSASRAQTLAALDLDHMQVAGDTVTFQIYDLLKGSKPGRPIQEITLQKYCDRKLCVVDTLLEYLERTKIDRRSRKLLVSFKTFKNVTTSSIARWLKTVLVLSGIDGSVFKAHSYRGASTSAAYYNGVSLATILKTANWASATTFKKFYYRQVADTSTNFANQVLGQR